MFTQEHARRLGIRGWVRNLVDGRVETTAAAAPDALTEFEALLREGPEHARVDAVQITDVDAVDLPERFVILSDSDATDAIG